MAMFDLENLAGNGDTVAISIDDDGTALIEFGHSYTLRLDENNIDILRGHLFQASKELGIVRSNKAYAEHQANVG